MNNRLPLPQAREFNVADQSSIAVRRALLVGSSSAPVARVLILAVRARSIQLARPWAVRAVPAARDNGLALELGPASELDRDLADLAQDRVVLLLRRPKRDVRNAPRHADEDAGSSSIQKPKKAR